jgi:hypothetical protein
LEKFKFSGKNTKSHENSSKIVSKLKKYEDNFETIEGRNIDYRDCLGGHYIARKFSVQE